MYCSTCGRSCSCAANPDNTRYPKDPGVYRPLLPNPAAVAEVERLRADDRRRASMAPQCLWCSEPFYGDFDAHREHVQTECAAYAATLERMRKFNRLRGEFEAAQRHGRS